MIKRNLHGIIGASLVLAIAAVAAQAVELPNIFSSHMVIQRDVKAPVWGKAAPKATVTVEFAGQKKTAVADDNGKWMIKLDPMKANAKPQTMTVSEPPSVVTYEDVLVGDNWLCSGQSNMEWDMNGTANSQQERDDVVNYPTIRFFRATEHISVATPLENAPGAWNLLTPDSVRPLTAVGYFFARKINKELNIPIGIVQSAWGGSPIEPWTTPAGFRMVPELADFAKRTEMFDLNTEAGQQTQKDFIKRVSDWLPTAKVAAESGKAIPQVPEMPRFDGTTGMYNGMINPLVPYAIKGALWYQGEANGGEGISYFQKMQALIGGWRKAFGVGDFPFYFVQLANFQNPSTSPEGGDGWARVREAQRKSLEIPNTGMAVAIDLADEGNPGDIHPKNKQDVGGRLANWALYQAYGKKNVVASGPLFKSMTIDESKIVVSFDWVGSGLIVGEKKGLEPVKEIAGSTLKGFAIAGEDNKWVWADAKIVGKTVVLSSESCPKPVAARYAYSMNPATANLYNKDGMPAAPFTTTTW